MAPPVARPIPENPRREVADEDLIGGVGDGIVERPKGRADRIEPRRLARGLRAVAHEIRHVLENE
jgi:hypothetical protein